MSGARETPPVALSESETARAERHEPRVAPDIHESPIETADVPEPPIDGGPAGSRSLALRDLAMLDGTELALLATTGC